MIIDFHPSIHPSIIRPEIPDGCRKNNKTVAAAKANKKNIFPPTKVKVNLLEQ